MSRRCLTRTSYDVQLKFAAYGERSYDPPAQFLTVTGVLAFVQPGTAATGGVLVELGTSCIWQLLELSPVQQGWMVHPGPSA